MDFRNAKDISIGGKSASKIYLDDRLIWQKTQPITVEGLCFTALEPNSTVKTTNNRIISPEISYDGKSWSTYTEGTVITLANEGDKVYLRSQRTTHPASGNYTAFVMSGSIGISGNIFDLLKETNGEVYDSCFRNLFRSCTSLKSTPPDLLSKLTTAPDSCCRAMFVLCSGLESGPTSLPATELGSNCYNSMFYGTSITTPPELPATKLATQCYNSMFRGCTSLTTAPELPATELAVQCYYQMFYGCSKLTAVQSILQATTLAEQCYSYMFYGCTSLTTAPTLPATELAMQCYYQMFYGCTSLTTAPTLPAPTLVYNCYYRMFYNCSNLNLIIVGATEWDTTYASNWLSGVSSTGRFYRKAGVSIPQGASGIPSGWTNIPY